MLLNDDRTLLNELREPEKEDRGWLVMDDRWLATEERWLVNEYRRVPLMSYLSPSSLLVDERIGTTRISSRLHLRSIRGSTCDCCLAAMSQMSACQEVSII